MNLPFAYIRSKPKDHGAGNQIEGRELKVKMVVVEDLISTGGSVLEAVAAAKREEQMCLEL